MRNEELIKLNIDPKEHIALWKISNETSDTNRNIFLTHGTFSNRKVCMGIADFLIEEGYTCWIMEWRNHGDSSKINTKFNFETIAKKDIKIAFDYLFDIQKIQKIDCITHSGGGISLTIALIEYPEYHSKITRIIFFASQAYGAVNSFSNQLKAQLGKWAASILGFLPARLVGSPEDEPYHLMKQWFNWNLSKNFLGDDGFDYQEKMKEIDIPILSICGLGDTFIAPKSGCEEFLNAFENPHNQLLVCGKETGYKEDYNHGRILHSRSAREEIYPTVLDWLRQKK